MPNLTPTPAGNPLFPRSLFPNALDVINDAPDSVSDAIGALQSTLMGSPGAPLMGAMNSGTMSTTGQMTVGGTNLWGGTGAPAGTLGAIGDFYFRRDTPGTSLQRIYVKTGASAWTGIV